MRPRAPRNSAAGPSVVRVPQAPVSRTVLERGPQLVHRVIGSLFDEQLPHSAIDGAGVQ